MAKTIYSPYHTGYKCASCKVKLTKYAILHNEGTCPKCGATCEDTVVKYEKFSYRTKKVSWFDFSFPFYHKAFTIEELGRFDLEL